MKILFLPFLQMKTGHHTVADALIRSLEQRVVNISCSKIDFFSYADKHLEKAFRLTYLTWIDHSPLTFDFLYRYFVYPSKASKHFNWFEFKFLDKMKFLIDEEQPDLIICTQAFPSFLLSRLRSSGISTPPVINVYTDYFINKLWGIEGIDYHFVPDQEIRSQLIATHNVNANKIYVTGIPIDECFSARNLFQPTPPYNILISGGSGGLGDIENLITNLPQEKKYFFSVLCGKNNKLYKEIFSLKLNNVKPLSYISSRDTMNALYNQSHAIITKPGGVTLSETLYKRLPVFIHSSLPGQEEINKQYFLEKKLIYSLDLNYRVSDQLDSFFENENEQINWYKRVNSYFDQIECPAWQKIIEILVKIPPRSKHFEEKISFSRSTN